MLPPLLTELVGVPNHNAGIAVPSGFPLLLFHIFDIDPGVLFSDASDLIQFLQLDKTCSPLSAGLTFLFNIDASRVSWPFPSFGVTTFTVCLLFNSNTARKLILQPRDAADTSGVGKY